jgi:hypothetical protein
LCKKGDAFLIPSGQDKHLYIIVTEEDDDGMHVLVNVTSIKPNIAHDETCPLEKGEHSFIEHPSYIAYGFAIERHKKHIDDNAKVSLWIQKEDASEKLLAKICEGIKKSRFTKRGIKDAYDKCVQAAERRKKQVKK